MILTAVCLLTGIATWILKEIVSQFSSLQSKIVCCLEEEAVLMCIFCALSFDFFPKNLGFEMHLSSSRQPLGLEVGLGTSSRGAGGWV